MNGKKKKRSVQAVCKECNKRLYSQTSNKDGRIICASCDKQLARNLKY